MSVENITPLSDSIHVFRVPSIFTVEECSLLPQDASQDSSLVAFPLTTTGIPSLFSSQSSYCSIFAHVSSWFVPDSLYITTVQILKPRVGLLSDFSRLLINIPDHDRLGR